MINKDKEFDIKAFQRLVGIDFLVKFLEATLIEPQPLKKPTREIDLNY